LVSEASTPETQLTDYLQHINSPTFNQPESPVSTTDALPDVRQHPATSELRSMFAGYVCTCGTCVLSEWTAHASKPSTHVQLSVENFGIP